MATRVALGLILLQHFKVKTKRKSLLLLHTLRIEREPILVLNLCLLSKPLFTSISACYTTAYPKNILPRKNAIQRLDELIMSLQQEKHAIVLMVDANQTSSECFSSNEIKPYSIEWLKKRRCLIDPFISLCGSRPDSTTQTPNRDIDFVLTYGISISAMSRLGINKACHVRPFRYLL